MATGKRTIYSYESNIFSLSADGTKAELRWKPSFIKELFNHIWALDEKDRVMVKTNEWFFYLANLVEDTNEKDPTHRDCIYGWFESVRIGFRTKLKRLSTMKTRDNPKEYDESEIHKTFFYIRLSDGLLFFDNYKENVVTPNRIEKYLADKGTAIFQKYNVKYITFSNILSRGFLEELHKFDVIRFASIRLRVTPDAKVHSNDAIGQLEEESRAVYANYLDLVIGRKNARKKGLLPDKLKEFLNKILRNEDHILSGVIEGARSDGGSPKLKLKGIEEKYYNDSFEKDVDGEILPDPLFQYMINIGNSHSRLG